jgi:hypothetical protein
MRRVFLGAALSALLLTGSATGQSADQPTTTDTTYDRRDDSGKWGLLGLVGLLGLMGLKRKDEVVRTSTNLREGTSTAR